MSPRKTLSQTVERMRCAVVMRGNSMRLTCGEVPAINPATIMPKKILETGPIIAIGV